MKEKNVTFDYDITNFCFLTHSATLHLLHSKTVKPLHPAILHLCLHVFSVWKIQCNKWSYLTSCGGAPTATDFVFLAESIVGGMIYTWSTSFLLLYWPILHNVSANSSQIVASFIFLFISALPSSSIVLNTRATHLWQINQRWWNRWKYHLRILIFIL